MKKLLILAVFFAWFSIASDFNVVVVVDNDVGKVKAEIETQDTAAAAVALFTVEVDIGKSVLKLKRFEVVDGTDATKTLTKTMVSGNKKNSLKFAQATARSRASPIKIFCNHFT